MKFRLPRFLRSDTPSTLDLVELTLDILEGSYVPLDAHTARVRELLEVSNVNMELRRKAEQAARDAEMQTLRAVRFARQNVGIVKAVDWLNRPSGSACHTEVLDCISAFVAGFVGENDSPAYETESFKAGRAAKRSDIALTSAAHSVGLKDIA